MMGLMNTQRFPLQPSRAAGATTVGNGIMRQDYVGAPAPVPGGLERGAPPANAPPPPMQRPGMVNAAAQGGYGLGGSISQARNQAMMTPDQGGVVAGRPPTMNAVQQAQMNGPSAQDIQAEMRRRQVGSEIGANPANAAVAGYMMG